MRRKAVNLRDGIKTVKRGLPALDTVAGVAVRRWLISNTSLMVGFRGIRSLLARVSTLEKDTGDTRSVYIYFWCIVHSVSLDYVTCFPQLFPLLSESQAHTVTSSLIHWVQIGFYCCVSDVSTTSPLFMSKSWCVVHGLWVSLKPSIYSARSHLVVIHDCVEGLNPHRVNVSIQHNPLGPIVTDIG